VGFPFGRAVRAKASGQRPGALAWAVCGLLAVAPAVRSQPAPAEGDAPQVELYSGVTRTNPPKPPAPKPKPKETSAPAVELPRVEPPPMPALIGTPAPWVLEAVGPRPPAPPARLPSGPIKQASLKPCEVAPLPEGADARFAETTSEPAGRTPAGKAETVSTPATVVLAAREPAENHAAADEPFDPKKFVTGLVGQLAGTLGSLAVSLVVLLLAFAVLRRKLGLNSGALLRVELINPNGGLLREYVAVQPGSAEAVVPGTARTAPPVPEEEPIIPNFELGPTYEEEREMQVTAARQAESALLMHIFEENVKLRDEIAGLAGAGV
jgi:hypothetical protein